MIRATLTVQKLSRPGDAHELADTLLRRGPEHLRLVQVITEQANHYGATIGGRRCAYRDVMIQTVLPGDVPGVNLPRVGLTVELTELTEMEALPELGLRLAHELSGCLANTRQWVRAENASTLVVVSFAGHTTCVLSDTTPQAVYVSGYGSARFIH
jgi:hypothetical protein